MQKNSVGARRRSCKRAPIARKAPGRLTKEIRFTTPTSVREPCREALDVGRSARAKRLIRTTAPAPTPCLLAEVSHSWRQLPGCSRQEATHVRSSLITIRRRHMCCEIVLLAQFQSARVEARPNIVEHAPKTVEPNLQMGDSPPPNMAGPNPSAQPNPTGGTKAQPNLVCLKPNSEWSHPEAALGKVAPASSAICAVTLLLVFPRSTSSNDKG